MKRLTLILVFFAFFLANAQEMDTTYVINEHGQTIGIIHEKGTIPVMPQQAVAPQQMQQPVQQYPAQQPYAIQPQYQAPVYDSTAYYQALIEKYMQSGTSLRSTGKAMMIGGGIGAFLGIAFLVVADNECEEDRYGDEVCDNDAENLSDAGAILFLGGAAVFGTGIALKIVGSSKLRKAIRYNDKLMKHQMRRQFTMNLRVNPLVNPVKQSVGGNLALEF
jgi:hypothetical protein